MKEESGKAAARKILSELVSRMPENEGFRKTLEAFSGYPPDRVADTILRELEYLLGSDLRELIIHIIDQELAAEERAKEPIPEVVPSPPLQVEPVSAHPEPIAPPVPASPPPVVEEVSLTSTESIMEHFGPKESFPSDAMDIQLYPSDWFYIYGFSYAPNSTGKGIPTRKLRLKGIDGATELFLIDYGDVRLYMNKLAEDAYALDTAGRPTLASQKANNFRVQHEKILNILRGEEVVVTLPFWTILQGREQIIKVIEDHYVELLRALIDVHDAIDWDVEVFALDSHMITLPDVARAAAGRSEMRRESRHTVGKAKDVKMLERLIFREKDLAQQIHSSLLLHALKSKVDYIVRLDAALMDDWKPILLARYTVGKEKRKPFCQTIIELESELAQYELMIKMTSPTTRFSFPTA